MLKHIPSALTAPLLCAIDDMGRGDELVIADANFPRTDMHGVIRADGYTVTELLDAILMYFPLDGREKLPLTVCYTSDEEYVPPVWADIEAVVRRSEESDKFGLDKLEKYSFEKRCSGARFVVISGDTDSCATIILKKGDV